MSAVKRCEVNFDKDSGEKVSFPSDHPDGAGVGYLFGCPATHKKAIVLLHEWWGVDDFTRDMAERMSGEGFAVLVVDYFRGKVFMESKKAREHMLEHFNFEHAAMDVAAGARYLKSRGCTGVGATGCGMGASVAMVTAAKHAELDAVAPNSGCPKPAWADLAAIAAPVQGHYGSRDKVAGVSSPADYNAMAERLWGAGVALEMCIYDADHAFHNPNYPRTYSETATGEFYENLYRFMTDKLA